MFDRLRLCLGTLCVWTEWTRYQLVLHSFPHDALPIYEHHHDDNLLPDDHGPVDLYRFVLGGVWNGSLSPRPDVHRRELGKLRSEEHTSELQSREQPVCRFLRQKT